MKILFRHSFLSVLSDLLRGRHLFSFCIFLTLTLTNRHLVNLVFLYYVRIDIVVSLFINMMAMLLFYFILYWLILISPIIRDKGQSIVVVDQFILSAYP